VPQRAAGQCAEKRLAALENHTVADDNSGMVEGGPNLVPEGGPTSAGQGFFESLVWWAVVLRVVIFYVLAYGISATFGSLAGLARVLTSSSDPTGGLVLSECARAGGTLLAAWVMARFEGRRLGEFGLPWMSGQGRLVLQGAAFGIIEIGVIVGVLGATGYYTFGMLEIHGAVLIKWAIFWAALFSVVALFEESAFRGYAQFALTKGFGFWPATIVTSLFFGAVHIPNPGENWAGIAGVVAVGVFWCFTLRRTGSLWFAFGMHAAFDFGETFLFSVPDSGAIFPGHLSSAVIHPGPAWLVGGTAGPEASVLDFLILAIFFFVVHKMYPAKPELPLGSASESANEFSVSIEAPSAAAGGESQRTSSEA
jgi:uncharacterized protein